MCTVLRCDRARMIRGDGASEDAPERPSGRRSGREPWSDYMTELDKLKALIAKGELHHATYRNRGTVWEGVWFYRHDTDGFRGFSIAGCVNKVDPDFEESFRVLAGHGMSIGAFGEG